jgi:hypothetical protein
MITRADGIVAAAAIALLLGACGGPAVGGPVSQRDDQLTTAPYPPPSPDAGSVNLCCPQDYVLSGGNACCPACVNQGCALPCLAASSTCPPPPPACAPACAGKLCGADDGCGHACEADCCEPIRTERVCSRRRCVDKIHTTCGPIVVPVR